MSEDMQFNNPQLVCFISGWGNSWKQQCVNTKREWEDRTEGGVPREGRCVSHTELRFPSVSFIYQPFSASTLETCTEDIMCERPSETTCIFHQSEFSDCLSVCVLIYVWQGHVIGKALFSFFTSSSDSATIIVMIAMFVYIYSWPTWLHDFSDVFSC